MKFLLLLLISGPASPESFELLGKVLPGIEIALEPFNDGYAIRNIGNAMALFQIGAREKSGRQVAWLRQSEQLLLRTTYLPKTGGAPVEIRILAP